MTSSGVGKVAKRRFACLVLNFRTVAAHYLAKRSLLRCGSRKQTSRASPERGVAMASEGVALFHRSARKRAPQRNKMPPKHGAQDALRKRLPTSLCAAHYTNGSSPKAAWKILRRCPPLARSLSLSPNGWTRREAGRCSPQRGCKGSTAGQEARRTARRGEEMESLGPACTCRRRARKGGRGGAHCGDMDQWDDAGS